MSETHQSHPPDPLDAASSSAANWFTGWDSFTIEDVPPADDQPPTPPSAPPAVTGATETTEAAEATGVARGETDWQTVDFPNAISMDAIDRQLLYAQPAVASSAPPVAGAAPVTVRMDDIAEGNAHPQVDELISLIQELNQCNNALLDRVSQLEETLDQYQATGLDSPDRSMAGPSSVAAIGSEANPSPQVAQLTNELEFARQAHKRQEILVETLRGQLDNSQERVAQLERECALMQQKYNDQVQAVAQYENTCRDLRARLHRQQRYTMQFKVALEKSLEVPPPSYAAASLDAPQADIHIPLWYEAQASLSQELLPKIQRIQPWSSQSQSKFLEKLNLTALPEDSPPLSPLDEARPPAMHDLDADLGQDGTELTSPPISYTINGQDDPSDPSPATTVELTDLELSDDGMAVLPEDVIKAGVAEFQAVLNSLWDDEVSTSAEAAQVEEGLWKDLARLIDVSPDELVKASLANNFDAFADADGTPAPAPLETSPAPVTEQPIAAEDANPASSTDTGREAKTASPFIANPNWPSPLVHPLRPTRKLSSLAAVNLPKFAQ